MLGAVPLHLVALGDAYRSGALTPPALVEELLPALDASDDLHIWIARVPADGLRAAARELGPTPDPRRPLWGVPFAVKDNIDVAGMTTTAGCPGFAYRPARSAPVVERLLAAGALLVGKVNLDQLATGLVGVRSPYGVPPNPFDAVYIPGGSSSGSAAAVARGLVAFALGTDTAGSGRVPAAVTNTVGLKPSRGIVPLAGVVPACRSLDCVSVHALTVDDALAVCRVAAADDAPTPFGAGVRPRISLAPGRAAPAFRFGVPDDASGPLGDAECAAAFARATAGLVALGGTPVPIDMTPFFAAGRLLYQGPWIAERLSDLEAFVAEKPDALLEVTREILLGGARFRGTQVFAGLAELEGHRRAAAAVFAQVEVLAVPTVPSIPTLAEVRRAPSRPTPRSGATRPS